MEGGCKRVDVEAMRYGAPEAGCRSVNVEGVDVWSCRALEVRCRHVDVEV